ncbi:MAG TPA: TraR/DksA C4-type zinc finger protein [Candidatus Paceibacterota bacterium]|jgi:RNA polymerase-binding transcription factor DksA|nr:TraR/DksA C4-type zinc finger protein [Candidatus Paceibacterota bacterium]
MAQGKKLTQEELDSLRESLEAERDRLEEELSAHGRVLNDAGDWEGASIGFEGEEADPNDAADQIEELVTNVPLVAELEERHTDIAEAIEKMDEGVYGICEVGGEAIDLDRLKANPAARTCLEHSDE